MQQTVPPSPLSLDCREHREQSAQRVPRAHFRFALNCPKYATVMAPCRWRFCLFNAPTPTESWSSQRRKIELFGWGGGGKSCDLSEKLRIVDGEKILQ